MTVTDEFARHMTQLRADAGLTVRGLARQAHLDPAHVSRLERGQRPPTLEAATALDKALGACGQLVALVPAPDAVKASARESERLTLLLQCAGGDLADGIGLGVHQLAIDYLAQPAGLMLDRASSLRRTAVDALKRTRRPSAAADLTVHIGATSGVLAYAALDLGDPVTAHTHAALALRAAETTGDAELRAWARGTQSLIARFAGDYRRALDYALDGLEQAPREGTGRARLLAGVAQCHANMGDATGARHALDVAGDVREHAGEDGPGLFGFSRAKQLYYGGSSLMWLPGRDNALRARDEALEAIRLWKASGPHERSHDDEALAHVYAATACLTLHDLEHAVRLLEPILSLPAEQRISWIGKRLDNVASILGRPPYDAEPLAVLTRERIAEYR